MASSGKGLDGMIAAGSTVALSASSSGRRCSMVSCVCSRGDVRKRRAQGRPYFCLDAAAGVGKRQTPVGPVARLRLRCLRYGEDAPRLGARGHVFDGNAFFHICFLCEAGTRCPPVKKEFLLFGVLSNGCIADQ